jgi:dihydrofolate synthase/folylpolyglutamate synthase
MNYQQALDYLYSFMSGERATRPPPETNLQRTAALLRAIGDPQHVFPSVIVAGTKGKGSTAVLVESIARAAGLRVGLWTSPHLHSYRERIQVDRQPIAPQTLADMVEALQPHIAAVTEAEGGPPVTFAIGFALALRYFADRQVDLAVLEVGLGGTYDSAAVVEPLLAIITAISYDHMEILGPTLTAIAEQKAGIMRPGRPALSAPQEPAALAALVGHAAAIGAPLYLVEDSRSDRPAPPPALAPLRRIDPLARYAGAPAAGLRGAYQRENILMAIAAAQLLRAEGLPIDDAAIAAGLAGAHWPARFEVVGDAPPIVIDGAHNGDSARRLMASLAEAFPGRPLVLVFGTSREKDLERMLPELIPHARAVVLTYSRHPRALADLEQLQQQIRSHLRSADTPLLCIPDPPAALAQAQALAHPDDVICITGSLFVAAAAREALGLAVSD